VDFLRQENVIVQADWVLGKLLFHRILSLRRLRPSRFDGTLIDLVQRGNLYKVNPQPRNSFYLYFVAPT
jgi:hypothetical protein